jgi:hypothetical protein
VEQIKEQKNSICGGNNYMRNKIVGSEKQKYGLHKEQMIRLYGEWKFATWKNSRLYGNKKLVHVTNHYYKEIFFFGVHMEPKFIPRDIWRVETTKKVSHQWNKSRLYRKQKFRTQNKSRLHGNKILVHKTKDDYKEGNKLTCAEHIKNKWGIEN